MKKDSIVVAILRKVPPVIGDKTVGHRTMVAEERLLAEAKFPVFHVKVGRVHQDGLGVVGVFSDS